MTRRPKRRKGGRYTPPKARPAWDGLVSVVPVESAAQAMAFFNDGCGCPVCEGMPDGGVDVGNDGARSEKAEGPGTAIPDPSGTPLNDPGEHHDCDEQ